MPSTCGSCGAPLLPTMRFCTSCGAANPPVADSSTAADAQDSSTSASPHAFGEPGPDAGPTDQYPSAPPTAPYQATAPSGPPPPGQPYGQQYAQQPYPAPQPPADHQQLAQSEAQQPYPSQAPYAQPSQPPASTWQQPGSAKKSKKGVFLVIGLLVLLLVASGAGIWWFLIRDTQEAGTAAGVTSEELPRPITDQPDQAWSWPVSGSVSVAGVGNYVVVGSDDGIRLFGTDDQPLWTNQDATTVRSRETPHGKVWGWHESERTAVLVDVRTGRTDQSYPGWSPYGLIGTTGNSLLTQYDEESYEVTAAKVVDEDGEEAFDLPAFTTLSRDQDMLYLADADGTLTAISGTDGQEKWSIEIPSWTTDPEKPFEGPEFAHLSKDEFFLRTSEGLQLRSTSDGSVKKNEKTDDLDCGHLSQVAPFMAMCGPATTDFSKPETTDVVFFDASGEKGTVQTDQPYFTAVEQGTDWYLFNHGDNVVYDTSFAKVGQVASAEEGENSDVTFTRDGVYVAADTLELKDLTGESTWSVEIPAGTPADTNAFRNDLVATDDLVVVLKHGVVTAWQR